MCIRLLPVSASPVRGDACGRTHTQAFARFWDALGRSQFLWAKTPQLATSTVAPAPRRPNQKEAAS